MFCAHLGSDAGRQRMVHFPVHTQSTWTQELQILSVLSSYRLKHMISAYTRNVHRCMHYAVHKQNIEAQSIRTLCTPVRDIIRIHSTLFTHTQDLHFVHTNLCIPRAHTYTECLHGDRPGTYQSRMNMLFIHKAMQGHMCTEATQTGPCLSAWGQTTLSRCPSL